MENKVIGGKITWLLTQVWQSWNLPHQSGHCINDMQQKKTGATKTCCIKNVHLPRRGVKVSPTIHYGIVSRFLKWLKKLSWLLQIFFQQNWKIFHLQDGMVVVLTRECMVAIWEEWPNGSMCQPTRGRAEGPKFSSTNLRPTDIWSMMAL